MFAVLPWLAVLWPLCLRRNWSLQVLWVGLPLGISLALSWLLARTPLAIALGELFRAPLNAVAFGLAVAWLLSPHLGRKGRFLAFLGTLLAIDLSGWLVMAVSSPWVDDLERHLLTIRMAALGAILTLAFHLAGWTCRGRFGRGRLLVRLLLWVVGWWAVALCVALLLEGPGSLSEMPGLLLLWVSSSLALLLPFLALSLVSDFFRARLKQVLRLEEREESLTTDGSPAAKP